MKLRLFASHFFLAAFAALSALALATQSVSAASLSNTQKGAISQNCNSIKTSLQSLQKSDSRTRVLLGTSYQTILSNFLTPLNLRLVRDNQPNTTLSNIQTSLASERTTFQEQFVKYSQQLEDLLAIDCQAHPEDFYSQLQATRSARSSLNKTATHINHLVEKHITAVTELRSAPADASKNSDASDSEKSAPADISAPESSEVSE